MAAGTVGPFSSSIQCALEELRSASLADRQTKFKRLEEIVQAALSSMTLEPSVALSINKSLSSFKASISSNGEMNVSSIEPAINQLIKSGFSKQTEKLTTPPLSITTSSSSSSSSLVETDVIEMEKQKNSLLALGNVAIEELNILLSEWKDYRIPLSSQVRMLRLIELRSFLNSEVLDNIIDKAGSNAGEHSSFAPNSIERFEIELIAMEQSLDVVGELNFDNPTCSSFPESIKLFRQVRSIKIDCPNLTTFPDFRHFPLLTHLNIAGCIKIQESPDLSQNLHLVRLRIVFCGLIMPPDLSKNNKLESLDLSHNKLRENPNLANNPVLSRLKVSMNKLKTPPNIKHNPKLSFDKPPDGIVPSVIWGDPIELEDL